MGGEVAEKTLDPRYPQIAQLDLGAGGVFSSIIYMNNKDLEGSYPVRYRCIEGQEGYAPSYFSFALDPGYVVSLDGGTTSGKNPGNKILPQSIVSRAIANTMGQNLDRNRLAPGIVKHHASQNNSLRAIDEPLDWFIKGQEGDALTGLQVEWLDVSGNDDLVEKVATTKFAEQLGENGVMKGLYVLDFKGAFKSGPAIHIPKKLESGTHVPDVTRHRRLVVAIFETDNGNSGRVMSYHVKFVRSTNIKKGGSVANMMKLEPDDAKTNEMIDDIFREIPYSLVNTE